MLSLEINFTYGCLLMRKFNIKIKKTIISVLLISSVFGVSIPRYQVVEAKTLSQLKNEREQLAKKSADG